MFIFLEFLDFVNLKINHRKLADLTRISIKRSQNSSIFHPIEPKS